MSSTLQDRFKLGYEKGINEGRGVLIRVCRVLLAGVPVADKFIGLSNTQKKNLGFNTDQIRHIESGCALEDMDITLLHVIIRAFGGLGPCQLSILLKQLKDARNTFVHEQQTLILDKRKLRLKLTHLKTLYKSILEELKNHCDPAIIPLLDHDIADIETRLLSLEKTIDDHLQEKTEALRQAATIAATQMTQIATDATVQQAQLMAAMNLGVNQTTVKLEQNISQAAGTLNQSVAQITSNLEGTINQTTFDLEQNLTQTAANIDQQVNDSTHALTQKISQVTSTLDQATLNINQNLNQASIASHHLNQNMYHVETSLRKINEAISENKATKLDEKEVLASAQLELTEIISSMCQVQTAEWLDECAKASPDEILTEFIMLKVRRGNLNKQDCQESEQIAYQLVLEMRSRNGKHYDIILLTSEGGMGKTTFLKYIGWIFGKDPSLVKGLSDHDLLIYLECRNLGISCFDDLLKMLFPKTPKKFGMSFEEFKSFILDQKLLFVIDGYDEVHSGTKKAVCEILNLRNKRIIVSTRPGSLKNIKYLVPVDKEVVTMQLLGIQPSHYEEFVWKLLCILVEDEERRKNICKEFVSQLMTMIPTFGSFLNSPMILTHLTYLKVEEPEKMKNFANSTEVYEALRAMRIGKVLKRLESLIRAGIDLETLISEFMKIYDRVAVKTFINYQFELTPEIVLEFITEYKKHEIPHEPIMSTFFITHMYHEGSLPVKGYKYLHLTEQEFAFAKYLAMLIEKFIIYDSPQEDLQFLEMASILQDNLIWKFITGKINENDLIKEKSQISRFKNVIFFLIGELTRISHSKKHLTNIFETISDKLIDLGWYLNDSIEWSDTGYERDEVIDNKAEKLSSNSQLEGDDIVDEYDDIPIMNTEMENSKIKETIEKPSEELEESIKLDADTDIDKSIQEMDNEEKDQVSKFGKEDIIFGYLAEAKMDKHMTMSGITKLSTKKSWKITNGACFYALNQVLKSIEPEEIVISLESDPLMFPDLHKTISILTKKKISAELYFSGHYNGQISGLSNAWLDPKVNLVDFLGRIDDQGVALLSNTLRTLHIGIDHTILPALNVRLVGFEELTVLGIRVNLWKGLEAISLPKLSYPSPGNIFCLTLVCEISDDSSQWVTNVVEQLCPDTRQGELSGLGLQNTHLTDGGIRDVLEALFICQISISGVVKVWTTCCITQNERQELDHLARCNGLGGLHVYEDFLFTPVKQDQGDTPDVNFTEIKQNRISKPKVFKILLLGESAVGKAWILAKLTGRDFPYVCTGVEFHVKKIFLDGEENKVQLWKLPGQRAFLSLNKEYYRGTHGYMLIYDITKMSSLEEIEFLLENLKENGQEKVPKILMGNKCDLTNMRSVPIEKGKALAEKHGMLFMEVSAKSQIKLDIAFNSIANKIASEYNIKSDYEQVAIVQIGTEKWERNKCNLQ